MVLGGCRRLALYPSHTWPTSRLVSKRTPFIIPSAPVLRINPPTGDGWIYELKFDGFRAQLHKDRDRVTIYSRNGRDMTRQFRALVGPLAGLPARTAIIDAEVVASDGSGQPDFRALLAGASDGVCAWCFDLLAMDGEDLRSQPLHTRRARLQRLLGKRASDVVRFSESFADPIALLEAVASMKLEGIVCKKADQPYRSGKNPGWVKVKTAQWKAANRDRGELFSKAKFGSSGANKRAPG